MAVGEVVPMQRDQAYYAVWLLTILMVVLAVMNWALNMRLNWLLVGLLLVQTAIMARFPRV